MEWRTERFDFPNGRGQTLAARLERPAGPVRAGAVFAHCFTCGMNVHAAVRTARALAARRIATLRFDFTGLGASEGDLAEESFTRNVDDLLAAVRRLEDEIGPVRILVGHSLGGTAALAAALRLEGIRLVATIGAPADPVHARRLFDDHLAEIERHGTAEVTLAGRTIRIGRELVEDLGGHRLEDRLRNLRAALLVLHGSRDEIVRAEQAERIFRAAPDPKSLVVIDGADHLLTRREDADWVAELLSLWATRHVEDRPPPGGHGVTGS
jgi:putative redox protein